MKNVGYTTGFTYVRNMKNILTYKSIVYRVILVNELDYSSFLSQDKKKWLRKVFY